MAARLGSHMCMQKPQRSATRHHCMPVLGFYGLFTHLLVTLRDSALLYP